MRWRLVGRQHHWPNCQRSTGAPLLRRF